MGNEYPTDTQSLIDTIAQLTRERDAQASDASALRKRIGEQEHERKLLRQALETSEAVRLASAAHVLRLLGEQDAPRDPVIVDHEKRIGAENAGHTLVQIWKLCETSNDSYPTLTEIARILSGLGIASDSSGDIFDEVWRAMQRAEEISGPDEKDYLALMDKIAAEATHRARVVRERQKITLRPMCPKCTSTGTDDLEIRETYSAYHPVVEVDGDGGLAVRNALTTGCPSEHFDDGKSDYVATCRSCLHEGTPESFGLGDPNEWDWV